MSRASVRLERKTFHRWLACSADVPLFLNQNNMSALCAKDEVVADVAPFPKNVAPLSSTKAKLEVASPALEKVVERLFCAWCDFNFCFLARLCRSVRARACVSQVQFPKPRRKAVLLCEGRAFRGLGPATLC